MNNSLSTFRAEMARRAATQDGINSVAKVAGLSAAALQQSIVGVADRAHAQYPQYAGYFSGPEWALVRFARDVRVKGGHAFRHGDVTIARQTEGMGLVAYSVRNNANTMIRYSMVVPMG